MTFNLRFETDEDGPNTWEKRKAMVADLIARHSPDILGTQEGKWGQLTYLDEMLPEYLACMQDRVYDPNVQCPTLFIKKDRFDVSGGKDVWLSETPDVYLSKSWDSAFPRMMSHCRLLDRKTGTAMDAIVTHLDHQGEEARVNQAKIIAHRARQADAPVVVMGDFNAPPDSQVHQVLTAPETPLYDTWQALDETEGEAAFTHHGFTGIPQRARMDWVLASRRFRVRAAAILHDQENGSYPSDHFPYMVDLDIR